MVMKKFTLLTQSVVLFLLFISIHPSFAQTSRTNVVLIIGDDLRYNSFAQTGGPSWFSTPGIDQLANEGATFDNYYCVYSLCIPARASIITGVYPHLNGAYDNTHGPYKKYATIARILDSVGYHNGYIGKYHIEYVPQVGFEFWFGTTAEGLEYTDPTMNYMGNQSVFIGNTTDMISDTAVAYLARVDTPFFVGIGHIAPHRPVTPQLQYLDYYANEAMPIPPNFSEFTKWYPSFLFDTPDKLYIDTPSLTTDLELYFEGLKGVDDNIVGIINVLNSRNLLDKTMIIFLGDNGALYGDHTLKGKGLPYEPSMQLPLFIRYPKWFPAGKHYSDTAFITTSIDIAPTIVDVSKQNPADFLFQGYSLKKLTNGSLKRDKFMFEKIKLAQIDSANNDEDDVTPSLRTLRTAHYKFNRYSCDHQVEEYFDLDNDPLELTNLLYHPDYQLQVAAARISLDSMQDVLADTLQTSIDTVHRHCHLFKGNAKLIFHHGAGDTIIIILKENPIMDELGVSINTGSDEQMVVSLYNQLGAVVYKRVVQSMIGISDLTIDAEELPQGMYFLQVIQGKNSEVRTVLKN